MAKGALLANVTITGTVLDAGEKAYRALTKAGIDPDDLASETLSQIGVAVLKEADLNMIPTRMF